MTVSGQPIAIAPSIRRRTSGLPRITIVSYSPNPTVTPVRATRTAATKTFGFAPAAVACSLRAASSVGGSNGSAAAIRSR